MTSEIAIQAAIPDTQLLDPTVIDEYLAEQRVLLEQAQTEAANSPHKLKPQDRAQGVLATSFLRFVGEQPDFVRKDEVKQHARDALFLAVPVGLTTYGISSYLGVGTFIASAGLTSTGLIMATQALAMIGVTGALIYMLDSSIMKSIKDLGVTKYIEARKIAADTISDAKGIVQNVQQSTTLRDKASGLLQGGKFMTVHNGSLIGRFLLSSAFAIVTTAKIIDVSLHSQDVDAIVIARHEAEQRELAEGLGMSNDELIAENKAKLDEARTELVNRKGEVANLEEQLTGSVRVELSTAEQARIAALQSDLTTLQADLERQQAIKREQTDLRTQEEHIGTETSRSQAGRGKQWNLANDRAVAAEKEIMRIEGSIREKTLQVDQINNQARAAALDAAAQQNVVRDGREDALKSARLRVEEAETNVQKLEGYRAWAEADPRYRELDLNERRFSALYEVLRKSGDGADYLMAGGIASAIMLAETSYILNKIAQKIPHSSSLRSRYHEMYKAEKEAEIQDIQERITFFEGIKQKIAAIQPEASANARRLGQKAQAIATNDQALQAVGTAELAARERQDAHTLALLAQQSVQAEIVGFLKTGEFSRMTPAEQEEVQSLVDQLRGSIIASERAQALASGTLARTGETEAIQDATVSIAARMEALRQLRAAELAEEQLRRAAANDPAPNGAAVGGPQPGSSI